MPEKVSARERLSRQRAEEKRNARRRRTLGLAAGAALALAVAGAGLWALTGHDDGGKSRAGSSSSNSSGSTGGTSGASDTALPPWPVPTDLTAAARAAGLDISGSEGTVKHFHAHLDLIVNGKALTVPGGIGVSQAQHLISELHTHESDGVVHIEAPTADKHYNLGQLFAEWQVKLSAAGMGGLKPDAKNTFTAYVDGKKVAGDPASIELLPHREIALVYGPGGSAVKVPSSYTFPQGE